MAQAPDKIPDEVIEFLRAIDVCEEGIEQLSSLDLYDERFTDEFIMRLRKMGQREIARWALIYRDSEHYVRFWACHPWGDYDGTGGVTLGRWRCAEFGTGVFKYYDNETDLEQHLDDFYTAVLQRELRPIQEEVVDENGHSIYINHDFVNNISVTVDL